MSDSSREFLDLADRVDPGERCPDCGCSDHSPAAIAAGFEFRRCQSCSRRWRVPSSNYAPPGCDPFGLKEARVMAELTHRLVFIIWKWLPIRTDAQTTGSTGGGATIVVTRRETERHHQRCWYDAAVDTYRDIEQIRNPNELPFSTRRMPKQYYGVPAPFFHVVVEAYNELFLSLDELAEVYSWEGVSDGSSLPSAFRASDSFVIPPVPETTLRYVERSAKYMSEVVDDIEGATASSEQTTIELVRDGEGLDTAAAEPAEPPAPAIKGIDDARRALDVAAKWAARHTERPDVAGEGAKAASQADAASEPEKTAGAEAKALLRRLYETVEDEIRHIRAIKNRLVKRGASPNEIPGHTDALAVYLGVDVQRVLRGEWSWDELLLLAEAWTPRSPTPAAARHAERPDAAGEPEKTLAEAPADAPTASGREGSPDSASRKPTVEERMLALYRSDPRSLDWTQREWAERLDCTPQAVAKTNVWKAIIREREARKDALRKAGFEP